MIENEIIKALECCIDMECTKCPLNYDDCEERDFESLVKRAIPIFNRQKAEIAELKSDLILKTNDYELLKSAYEKAENVSNGRKDRLMQKVVELQEARKEIERLTTMNSELNIGIKKLKEFAVKEFAERLHEKVYDIPTIYNPHFGRLIDITKAEMTDPTKIEHSSLCETETYVKE